MCTGQECRDQFTCRAFGLGYDRPTDFGLSQFGKKSLVYVIYRWISGLFFAVTLFYDFATYDNSPVWWKWLIFLTHWSFIILAIAALLGAVVALHVYLRHEGDGLDKNNYEMPVVYKMYWIFNNINLSVATVVTVMYWLVVFDPDTDELTYGRVTFHVVNLAWTIIDFLFSAVPIRILHFYHAIIYGLTYLVFTIIYWQAGGTNEQGKPYIYSVVNYEDEPGTAAGWIGFLIATLGVLHVVWFGLYRLRLFTYRSCGCGQVAPTQPTTRSGNYPI